LADRNAWSRASLPDRVFGGRRFLRGQPEAHFLETTASSLRRPVWDCSLPLHVLGGDAALGLSQASILDFRNNHRGRHSYRLRRASDISHCPPVLKPRNSADIAGSAVIAENGWETYRKDLFRPVRRLVRRSSPPLSMKLCGQSRRSWKPGDRLRSSSYGRNTEAAPERSDGGAKEEWT
jgi:hypothetical protein